MKDPTQPNWRGDGYDAFRIEAARQKRLRKSIVRMKNWSYMRWGKPKEKVEMW